MYHESTPPQQYLFWIYTIPYFAAVILQKKSQKSHRKAAARPLTLRARSGIILISIYTSEDNTSEDNTSEDNTSEDNTSEDNTSEDNTSEDNTSEDNTSEEILCLGGIIQSLTSFE
ncbi:MAG: hypothetical protein PHQ72_06340 [Hespellia sp.]|nr:hypothetical protein [Hespellia sp.]